MKYSLRSLMIAVTLICVVFGSRMEYLRRMAAFHERQAKYYEDELNRETEAYAAANKDSLNSVLAFPGLKASRANYYHEELAIAFRQAVYRPWMPFAEPQECTALRQNHPELSP